MTDWRDEAACSGKPKGFFPDESPARDVTAARKLCSGCTVQLECLADSPVDDKWSIRGGLEPGSRRRLMVDVA